MSNLDRTREYMVRNYSGSPVAIVTKDAQYMIPGGTRNAPAEFPMLLSEITYANSVSDVFKIGLLFFESEFEAEIYEMLRIPNWQDILRIDEIDDIILHPTTEKLRKVVGIRHHMYFDRIYGEYIMLKNSGRAISGSVESVMKLRMKEFQRNIVVSEIQVNSVDDTARKQVETDNQIKALQDQIATLTALLSQQNSAAQSASPSSEPTPAAEPAKKPAPKTSARTSKSTKPKGTTKQEG